MTLKGSYRQSYAVNRETKKLVVIVQLHQRSGFIKPKENLYYATATVDGKDITHKLLSHCVDAALMAERIGKETIETYKNKAKIDGKSFRLKRK